MKLNFPEELREFFSKKGKLGAAKRMKVLSPKQRQKIARKAAQARWSKEQTPKKASKKASAKRGAKR